MNPLIRVFEEKKRVKEELESILSRESISRARRDHHSWREPRPCGMTIHTGIGCSLGCVYCYVPDMGFPMKPKPYPLSPLELTYALALNPYVFPGHTLAAYGSVTEPFLKETKIRAIEYIATVYKYLKLPSQVSTKIPLTSEDALALKKAEPSLSVLVTVITLNHSHILEPNAPSPLERLESIRVLREHGLHVSLFMRPIIPGITDREAEKILAIAVENKVNGVVLGSLRVTPGILKRLSLKGYNVVEVTKRLPRKPRNNRDQVTIKSSDLKRRIEEYAVKLGVKVYPSACAANIEAHKLSCYACRLGPCGFGRPPLVKEKWIIDLIDYFNGSVNSVEVNDSTVKIKGLRLKDNKLKTILKHFTVSVLRRRLVLS